MAGSQEKLVLDERTGQLVFTVETVYLFPESGKQNQDQVMSDDPGSAAVPVSEPLVKDSDGTDAVGIVSTDVDSAAAQSDSVTASGSDGKEAPGPALDDAKLDSVGAQNGETDSRKDENGSSAYSTPKTRGPQAWSGPRPWVVNGRGKTEVLPGNRDGPHHSPGHRPATPPLNAKSPRVRSAPQSPRGRYPWTSVLRHRSGSTGKKHKEYVEQPIPIDFEDDEAGKPKEEPGKDRTSAGPRLGLKRPLARLFPKPKGSASGRQKEHGSQASSGAAPGQYEEFDSSSWSHVASEEDFELFPASSLPNDADGDFQLDPDLEHDDPVVTLPSAAPAPQPLELTTHTDHSSTKHSKHVTDSSTSETETTTNVKSDHTISYDQTSGTTIKTFTEQIQEVTTITVARTVDSEDEDFSTTNPTGPTTSGRLRSSSLVREFLDELESGSRKRAHSFPEKDAAERTRTPKRHLMSVPTTPLSARRPQTPGSGFIEFACGVKFERRSSSPRVSPGYHTAKPPHGVFLFRKNPEDDHKEPDDQVSDQDTRAPMAEFTQPVSNLDRRFVFGGNERKEQVTDENKETPDAEIKTEDVGSSIPQHKEPDEADMTSDNNISDDHIPEANPAEDQDEGDRSKGGDVPEIHLDGEAVKPEDASLAQERSDFPNFHVDENMSLEEMLNTLKTYLSSEDLLGDGHAQSQQLMTTSGHVAEGHVMQEVTVNQRETFSSVSYMVPALGTQQTRAQTERREEMIVSPRPKVLRVEPELERTLQTIRGMLSSRTEFLDFDVDVEDLPSPFGQDTQTEDAASMTHGRKLVEVPVTLREVWYRTAEEASKPGAETELRLRAPNRPRRQMSKSESEFEETLKSVRDFLASDAEVLDTSASSGSDHESIAESDLDRALDSIVEANHLNSDYDSDHDNKITARRQKPNQKPAKAETRDAPRAVEVPFQRYISFELNAPGVETTSENASRDTENDAAVTTKETPEIKSPDREVTFWCGSSDFQDEEEAPKSTESLTHNVDNKKLDNDNQQPYAQQMSVEFTPQFEEASKKMPNAEERKSEVEEEETKLEIEEETKSNAEEETKNEVKDEEGKSDTDETKSRSDSKSSGSSSSKTSKSSGSISLDFEDAPRDCSSPQGDDTDGTRNTHATAGNTEGQNYETVLDDYLLDELRAKDKGHLDTPGDGKEGEPGAVGMDPSAQGWSHSSSEVFFDDDDASSSLSILSAIGNRHSDFGSTEYLYVDLDMDRDPATDADPHDHVRIGMDSLLKSDLDSDLDLPFDLKTSRDADLDYEHGPHPDSEDELDERRKELAEEIAMQREVENLMQDFELQQQRVRQQEAEIRSDVAAAAVVAEDKDEEVCEEVVVEAQLAAGSFEVLEDLRKKHEVHEAGNSREETKETATKPDTTDVSTLDEVLHITEEKTSANEAETMEEILARLEQQ